MLRVSQWAEQQKSSDTDEGRGGNVNLLVDSSFDDNNAKVFVVVPEWVSGKGCVQADASASDVSK